MLTVPDATHFTTLVPSVGNQTQNNATVFPLVAPPLPRSGNVLVQWGTWVLNATDTGSTYSLGQTPLNSPTVFNFFFPGYKFPGPLTTAGLTTPEFQLTSDTTASWQMNFLEGGVLGNGNNTNGISSFNNGGGAIAIDLGPWMTPANTSNAGIPGLVDSLNSLLCGGQLSASAKTQIVNYANHLPLHHPDLHPNARPRSRRRPPHHQLPRFHHPEIALWKEQLPSALSRREFIRQAACAAVGTAAMTCAIRDLRFMNAAVAQSNITDYKALVCIFLAGGNDSNNLVIPTITSEYNNYAAIRTPVLAIPQSSLLPISPSNSDGHSYGLHPCCPQLQTLFGQGRLAILFNTGTLVYPLTNALIQFRLRPKGRRSSSPTPTRSLSGRPPSPTSPPSPAGAGAAPTC